MFVVIWEYKIKPGNADHFEQAYGPDGEWAQFFRQSKDFIGTELMKGIEASRSYVTIDRWTSEQAYVNFIEKHKAEYESLDDVLTPLTEFETKLGWYNSLND